MDKIKVQDSASLYRDANSGAILNCSDIEYDNYLRMKNQKLTEKQELDKLKDEMNEIKSMLNVVLSKLS
jgi:ribosomal protein L33